MPKKKSKNSSFNLIRKELESRKVFKGERDWYMTFNILIISTVIALSALSYVFSLYLDENLKNKKQELVDISNAQVYTTRRSFIKSKISVLNDKFTLYQEVKSQNFDMNTFYSEVKAISPKIEVVKLSIRPDATYVAAELRISSNAYTSLPEFLNAIKTSERFKGYSIESINFQSDGSNTTSIINNAGVSAEISLLLPKNDPQKVVN